VWRAAAPDGLLAEGWADLVSTGIRRVVDLRNATERGLAPHRPAHIEVVNAPLEDPLDADYTGLWNRNWAIADFYLWGIGRWPQLWSAALTAVADAPAGGVLVHCAGGRDRTGVLSAVLLDAAGVSRDAVLADYEAGMRGTNEMLRRQGRTDHEAAIPEDRIDQIIGRYRRALDAMLDAAPEAFAAAGLTELVRRAASRLRA
jgi:protein-tyrosine phosphatase